VADALIVYAAEKETAARRLHDALSAAGYAAELNRRPTADDGADEGLGEQTRSAAAAIVLWSKAAMASEAVQAAAQAARQRGNLIEVSADGIAPVASADANRVALISGWRGEPHHPGWQRVLADVKRLCAPPKKSGPVSPAALPARAAAPAPAAGAAPSRRPLALMLGVALLLVLGIAAAAWMSASGPQPTRETIVAAAPPAPPVEASPPAAADPQAPMPDVPEEIAPVAAPRPAPVPAAAAAPQSRPQARARPVERPARARYSANMRRFCAGSGRSTPQCRDFRRRTANAAPRPAPRPAAQSDVRYRNARNMRLFCQGAGRSTRECRRFRRQTGGD
jgi:hypothetical protein